MVVVDGHVVDPRKEMGKVGPHARYERMTTVEERRGGESYLSLSRESHGRGCEGGESFGVVSLHEVKQTKRLAGVFETIALLLRTWSRSM